MSKLGFHNLGSGPDIENQAFQNSCANPKKIHFRPKKGHFLVYFNKASVNCSDRKIKKKSKIYPMQGSLFDNVPPVLL